MGRERDDWTDERSENADPSGEPRKHPAGEVRGSAQTVGPQRDAGDLRPPADGLRPPLE